MPVYSHSRLQTFENCPRRFYYHYRKNLKTEGEESIEAFLGTLVHEALEQLYKEQGFGRILTTKQLVKWFDDRWQTEFHDDIAIIDRERKASDYRHLGRDALQRYHARYEPFNDAVTLGLENKVLVSVGTKTRHKLTGYIDRLSRRKDGTCEIHDYKTSKRLPSQEKIDADRQLALYQIGIQQRWPSIKRVELVWHYVRFDTELRSVRTRKQLKDLKAQIVSVIKDIESRSGEKEFETRESALCDWCEYQAVCPVRKHATKTAELPRNRFLKDSGVKLVNRWARLAEKISILGQEIEDLKAEQEEVKDAIAAYAARSNVEAVVGSTHKARVSVRDSVRLPRKQHEPEDYAVLEQKLYRSNAWPKVSTVDMHRLKRIWLGKEDDPGRVRMMLKPFVEEFQKTVIRMAAKK